MYWWEREDDENVFMEIMSPATSMGPPFGIFCHEHGTTRLPVMGPPGVSCRGS
jgi:hypothetical protein